MTANHSVTKDAAARAVLRRLALKAQGYSGADVERLVRESRQEARRSQRPLRFADLFDTLVSGRPEKPPLMRWRMAVHEAGHAIAYLDLGLGKITGLTIDSPDGGHIDVELVQRDVTTEKAASALLVLRLAGRAAEQEFLGIISAGSGGSPDSDLAQCTDSAIAMETTLGFSKECPLLYRPASDRAAIFTYNPSLRARVNTRLEEAYASARALIGRHRGAAEFLAGAIFKHDTLEGPNLEAVLTTVATLMRSEAAGN